MQQEISFIIKISQTVFLIHICDSTKTSNIIIYYGRKYI